MIYLDNNATTRVAPEVLEAMLPFLNEYYGNPSSAYSFAGAARNAVEVAREKVARLIGAADTAEIVFTSGGTESDNWAIQAPLANTENAHLITTQVEHEAVRNTADKLESLGVRVTRLAVAGDGSIDPAELRSALSSDTKIVSVMHANNETGVLFPIEELAKIVKENSDALFHVDGVNAVGKVPVDLKNTAVDMYSISGHKFHAPKGVGTLYVRRGVGLPAWFSGGGQEARRRPGTQAVHQIVGLGAAAEFVSDLSKMESVRDLRDRLESKILEEIPNSRLNGTTDPDRRLPNTSNIAFEMTNGEMIMARLDGLGICASTGSACASSDHSASPVLQAMNVPYSYAGGAVRFSFGRYNTRAEIDTVTDHLPGIVSDLRKLAG